MKRAQALGVMVGVMMWAVPGLGGSPALSPEEVDAVKVAHQAHVAAWLSNDPDAVMSTLTHDAVLVPHHDVETVIGADAIRKFWFPPGSPPTTVTRMVDSIIEVQGADDVAVVWGRSELEFVVGDTTFRNAGNYLSVLRKGQEGLWRIAKRIWNDPVAAAD